MALRAPVADSRRIASPALRALMSRRSAELGGLLLGLLALAILVALVTYDPRDPSLNTATSRRVTNLAGPGGTVLADILLQGFGLAGALPGLTLLGWAWRVVSDGRLSAFALRLAALLGAMPLLAAVLGSFPPPAAHWPVVAGLGGSIGQIIAHQGLALGNALFGVFGSAMIWTIGTALAGVLTLLALGLTTTEWRTAGRAAAIAGRYSVSGGRTAAGGVARAAGGVGAASGWLVSLVNRGPGLGTDDDADEAPPAPPPPRVSRPATDEAAPDAPEPRNPPPKR